MSHPRGLLASVLTGALALGLADLAAGQQLGSPYCFGVGCPCGNDDPTAGCGNAGLDGVTSTGATLIASGPTAYACADQVTMYLSGLAPGSLALVFMGGAQTSGPLDDGLLCVGGGLAGLHRFPAHSANAFGEIFESSLVAQSQSFPDAAHITAGSTWYFQGWYRDVGGPCGSGSNLSNALELTFLPVPNPAAERDDLVGNPLQTYPWFEYVSAINAGASAYLAVDPALHPGVSGMTADVYVVDARSKAGWEADGTLVDVRGAPQQVTFGADLAANTILLDAGTLAGPSDASVGRGYDVVVDMDRDGLLDDGDIADGISDEAGFYVVRDTSAPGPYTPVEILYSGGSWLGQDTYYPAEIATLGKLPLIVISHGNGHNYQWYDHIGNHMASYGYIVMSHQNNTQPGIESASTTTLTNTDYIIGHQRAIMGGVLAGHIDSHRIVWIGHSRGGEGVVRAYDRLVDGDWVPQHFTLDDIRMISSIAPTDFLGPAKSDPHGVDYHLWVGSADADVTGAASCDICQSYHLLERATGRNACTTLQGAGHAVFHDGGGSWVATGPCLIGPDVAHPIMLGYLLPLVRYYLDGDPPSKDFLWRQYERFHPIGAPITDPCVVVDLEYDDGPASTNFVVQDFEGSDPATSSSGTAVHWTVDHLKQGLMDDNNSGFNWTGTDPMNGMTRNRTGETTSRGVVFDWDARRSYEVDLLSCEQDLSDDGYLSFRACQGTRHPYTAAALEDLTFSVALVDTAGHASRISIGAFGGGIEEPYQRKGGWGNEFETIRVRLTDFLADGSGLDLTHIASVRFEFGGPGDSPEGRLGLDDIEITRQ